MHKPTMTPFLFAALFALPLLGGCFRYQPMSGSPGPAEPLGEGAWVEMETEPLKPLLEMPETIERYEFDIERLPASWRDTESDIEAMRRFHTDKLELARLDEHGLIRVWREGREREPNPIPASTQRKPRSFDRNGRYLTAPIAQWNERKREIEAEYSGGRGLKFSSKSMYGLPKSDFEDTWKLDEGFELAVPDSVREDTKGLIIHMTGMFETKYEQAMTNRLRAYGYEAAYLESVPFLHSPREEEEEIESAINQKRFYELIDEELGEEHKDLTDSEKFSLLSFGTLFRLHQSARDEHPSISGFAIMPETDVVELGRSIARLSDELIATHAYAAEAIVRASEQLHPVLSGKPIIVIGYSAGALSAPAVTARLMEAYPGRSIGLVLVGGGGDLVSLAAQSTLGDMVMNFKPGDGPEPTAQQLEELTRAYLNHTKLDPLVVAPAIRDVPTLHIYADKDRMVPTDAAERFNAAHGHVDRLVHAGNHGTLFFFLQSQAGKVRSWLRAHGME